ARPGDTGPGEPSAPERSEPADTPAAEPVLPLEATHPPEPPDDLAAASRKHPGGERNAVWGSAARALTLAAVIGAALGAFVQFIAFEWPPAFPMDNAVDSDQRATLLSVMLAGGAAALVASAGMLFWAKRRAIGLVTVERWFWFLSPSALLPALPFLFDYRPWQDEHESLLPILLLFGLVLEVLLHRALAEAPDAVLRLWRAGAARIPALVRRHGPLLAVITAALVYTVFMSFFTIRWHHKLGTGNYDLGINNNLMYGGLYGDFNQSAIVFPHNPAQYIANHVKIGLYAFLPIYAIAPRPETLQIILSTMLGFGSVPLFLFARRWLCQWSAAVIALCWLCYYPLHSANFYEVKEVPIGSFFVLVVAWAVVAKRWVVMGIAFVIGTLIREDMPVGFAVMGGFLLLTGYRPRVGAAMALVASSWFVFLRFKVMDEAGEWWFPTMYKDLWSPGEEGFRSVIKTLVANPFFTLTHVLVEAKVFYLLHLLAPILFLPARRWYLWAAFLPGALLTLLVTDYKPVTMFSFHYVMTWAPFLFLAVVLALAHYKTWSKAGPARAHATLAAMCVTILISSYNYGAFSLRDGALKSGYHKITFSMTDAERQTYAELKDIVSSIPPDASVAASERIGPHVSSRRRFFSLRRDSYHADYLIARQKELRLDRTKAVITRALTSGEYGVFRRVGPFVLMKRGHATTGNAGVIADWNLESPNHRIAD
ncbi:MAG TPA: DUF2079 domain-containing protein, partial [Polyangiaceae bacterium]|nr:DUF2079 domain-containing protein [Polyangiaceae bacterium]